MERTPNELQADSDITLTDPDEVGRILGECSACKSPSTIVMPGRPPVECELIGFDGSSVRLSLASHDSARVLAQSQTQVIIEWGGRRWWFSAQVESWRWSDVDGRVHLFAPAPPALHAYVFRKRDRVLLNDESLSLTCEVGAGSSSTMARVLDLSADGIGLVFLDDSGSPPIDVGHRVLVSIAFDGLRCQLVCQLRWRRGPTCGFKFDRPVGESAEPELLALLEKLRALTGFEAA